MQTKQFYYVETDKLEIIVTLAMFDSGPLPIVWNVKGLYKIVRVETVRDVFLFLTDRTEWQPNPKLALHCDDSDEFYIKYLIV